MSAKWGERMFSVSDLATLAETQRLQMPKKRQDTTASHSYIIYFETQLRVLYQL